MKIYITDRGRARTPGRAITGRGKRQGQTAKEPKAEEGQGHTTKKQSIGMEKRQKNQGRGKARTHCKRTRRSMPMFL